MIEKIKILIKESNEHELYLFRKPFLLSKEFKLSIIESSLINFSLLLLLQLLFSISSFGISLLSGSSISSKTILISSLYKQSFSYKFNFFVVD